MKLHKTHAFTLLEIVAALTLFSLLALGIVHALQENSSLTKKIKQRQATTLSGQIALERLERDLEQAYDERLQGSLTFFKSRESSQGPELSFSFLESPLHTLFERRTSGISALRYTLEKSDNGTLNLLRTSLPLHEKEKIQQSPAQLLATGVLKWELEFYDPRQDLWQKEWDSRSRNTAGRFPLAIRLALETVDPKVLEKDWKQKSLRFETEIMVLNEIEN